MAGTRREALDELLFLTVRKKDLFSIYNQGPQGQREIVVEREQHDNAVSFPSHQRGHMTEPGTGDVLPALSRVLLVVCREK